MQPKKPLPWNGALPTRRPRFLIIVPRAKFTIFSPMLALGPIMVGSAVQDVCDVKIIDNNSHSRVYSNKNLIDEIRRFQPDLLGINVVVANAHWAYAFIAEVRKFFPGLPVVSGGLHAYHASDEIFRVGRPDIVVTGEAELPTRRLINILHDKFPLRRREDLLDLQSELVNVKGLLLTAADGGCISTGEVELVDNLDDFPFLNFDLSNIQDYVPKGKDVFGVTSLVPTQRGCPYKCSFCKADFMGGRVRNHSAQHVVEQIELLHERFGLTQICFADNNFTIPRQRAIDVCKLLIERGLSKKITFRCWTNVLAPIEDDVLEALHAANFSSLQFGIERLTPEGMKAVDKIIDWKVVSRKLDIIKRHKLKVFTNLLVGFPFETEKTIQAERQLFSDNLSRIDGFQVWVVSPIPGTKLHRQVPDNQKWYLSEGFTKRAHAYFSIVFIDPMEAIIQNIFNLSKDTVKGMIKAKKELFLDYNYRQIRRWWLDPFFQMDLGLALFSKWLFERAPAIEHVLFWPLKKIRGYLIRRVVLSYYKATAKKSTELSDDTPTQNGPSLYTVKPKATPNIAGSTASAA